MNSSVENVNYRELYHSALANPLSVDDDTLSTLIDRFPYAQALRAARARKSYQDDGSANGESAVLITGLPRWLDGYIKAEHIPSERVNSVEQATSMTDTETAVPDIDDSGLLTSPVSYDYFAYEDRADENDTRLTEGPQEIVPLSEATPYEKVSLYNDEHLPYSFLWWLNKTRMEYASTYRPYVVQGQAPAAPTDRMEMPDDEQVLDHQIRENIFHLQSPEEKLSTAHPPETIPFKVPKKTDPIIERFIREEPQIKPPPADKINLENKARKSAEDQLTLVTETLANIYVEQGLYPKAIAIYKKLSLKYPEKSTYFGDRIAELTNKLP